MDVAIMLQLILIIVLTGLNAFFASAEMALVSVDKINVQQLAEEGNKKAKRLLEILAQPNKFLSTIQVGITLAGFLSSASAATGLAGGIGVFLDGIGVPFGNQLAIVFVTIILSYFILVFGELFPKRWAMGNSMKVALMSIGPIDVISKITSPFVKILSLSINGLIKIFKIDVNEDEDVITEERIRLLVKKGKMDGNITRLEEERIQSIFEFNNLKAHEIMLPADEVFMINIKDDIQDILDKLIDMRHTRVPVYEDNRHSIIGILHVKDIFELMHKSEVTTENILERLRKPIDVDADKMIDKLFLEMQKKKLHMAIVRGGENQMLGVITLEDMVEEIFGEIDDEFDE